MLTTQDKHSLYCQKVARALGQTSTGCRFGTERLRYLVANLLSYIHIQTLSLTFLHLILRNKIQDMKQVSMFF